MTTMAKPHECDESCTLCFDCYMANNARICEKLCCHAPTFDNLRSMLTQADSLVHGSGQRRQILNRVSLMLDVLIPENDADGLALESAFTMVYKEFGKP